MKGVILAGGSGSRLGDLTNSGINKHLLPVGKHPMLWHPITKLVEAGIENIMIVTGKEHAGSIINYVGSGAKFGCSISYAVQDEAGGIAQALGLTRNFMPDEDMCVLLGDNIFKDPLEGLVWTFINSTTGAGVVLKAVEDPERFGVAVFDIKKRIIKIEEKPERPKSNFAVTGIYFYKPSVYTIIDSLKPSNRGELEITDVNNYYIKSKDISHAYFTSEWTDSGTFSSLRYANEMFKDK